MTNPSQCVIITTIYEGVILVKNTNHMIRNICLGTILSTIAQEGCVQFVLNQQGLHSVVESGARIAVFAVAGAIIGATVSLKEDSQYNEDCPQEDEDFDVLRGSSFLADQKSSAENQQQKSNPKVKTKKKRISKR